NRPRLLVLDEPTAGVDPQSRNAILESVQHLAGEGIAVLYTTQYMEEAERLCDRVGIIDQGKMKAEGTRRELVQLVGSSDEVVFEAEGDLTAAAAALTALPEVTAASHDESHLRLLVPDARPALARMVTAAGQAGVTIRSVAVREPNLEAVFLHLTGRALRDRAGAPSRSSLVRICASRRATALCCCSRWACRCCWRSCSTSSWAIPVASSAPPTP